MPVRLLLKEYFKPSVLLPYLGPAFVVSVGYMDPGKWATDLEGGARFGYQLLWVLLASNITAIILQSLSAKIRHCHWQRPGPALPPGISPLDQLAPRFIAEISFSVI